MVNHVFRTAPHTQRIPALAGLSSEEHRLWATAHAAPVNSSRLARPSRLRCDNYHKKALFFRVLQQMSACKSGQTRGRRLRVSARRVWPKEPTPRTIQEENKEKGGPRSDG